MKIDETAITKILKTKNDPVNQGNLVDNGRISGLHVKDNHIQISLDIGNKANQDVFLPLKQDIEQTLSALDGVMSVTILFTAEKQQNRQTAPQQQAENQAKASTPNGLDQVKKVIAVASGKGGVGKSTTAINLAFALQDQGLKVGLLDADIYGPSLPRMLGKSQAPRTNEDKTIIPIEVHGLKTMSIGFVIGEEEPIIWRGPMVMGALQQMLKDVIWGDLDVLVVDMPPGTGDAQLTLSQQVPLAGAVIVSTPQDIALIDARKGLNMFKKTDVPVLGIVENMAYFICPHCGGESHIFGHEGAKREAEKLGVPFLGGIPLELAIRMASDIGHAVVLDARDKKDTASQNHANHYLHIAAKITTALFEDNHSKAKPKIIME